MGYSGRECWAWLADEGGGQRGIVAIHNDELGNWPLVMLDGTRARGLEPIVSGIARASGRRIELVQYVERRHVLWVPRD